MTRLRNLLVGAAAAVMVLATAPVSAAALIEQTSDDLDLVCMPSEDLYTGEYGGTFVDRVAVGKVEIHNAFLGPGPDGELCGHLQTMTGHPDPTVDAYVFPIHFASISVVDDDRVNVDLTMSYVLGDVTGTLEGSIRDDGAYKLNGDLVDAERDNDVVYSFQDFVLVPV